MSCRVSPKHRAERPQRPAPHPTGAGTHFLPAGGLLTCPSPASPVEHSDPAYPASRAPLFEFHLSFEASSFPSSPPPRSSPGLPLPSAGIPHAGPSHLVTWRHCRWFLANWAGSSWKGRAHAYSFLSDGAGNACSVPGTGLPLLCIFHKTQQSGGARQKPPTPPTTWPVAAPKESLTYDLNHNFLLWEANRHLFSTLCLHK